MEALSANRKASGQTVNTVRLNNAYEMDLSGRPLTTRPQNSCQAPPRENPRQH
ncbi:hypothetical protein HDF13_002753 [Edaphobacter lichenicola]|uniref:Uncharacterized protein n=1 Tax=Tunturiibacter gelidiferens TaxID=3069689 RepID=A0ACC5P0X5_9BACT|nr:hypothetical protein [Edaphobacter lichenicola]